MEPNTSSAPASTKMIWAILSVLTVLFLLFSAVMKWVMPPPVVQAFAHFGLPLSLALSVGILEFLCAVVYAVPQISVRVRSR
jgi:hypothetical protein